LSIAQSTLALLAFSGAPQRADGVSQTHTTAPPAHDGSVVLHNGAHLHILDAPVEQPVQQPDWLAEADGLIDAGATRIHRDKAALVLAELAEGTAPSTIARKVGVGYSTVARIADRRGSP
jgi:hypothetical protein